ncbi:MAG: Ku protein [Acidimicrobiia bacterium]
MPRSVWTGALSFGLVNVPVKLFAATQDKSVHFHQFKAGTGQRIRYKRVAEGTDDEVPYEEIVKGYEVRDGEYVMVTPEELDSVEPERSRTIDLESFVDLDEVDPIYFQRTYYMAPADESAAKPFELLRTAMGESNRAGIARFVMREKEYLVAVRPGDDVLLVETMHFPDEVRDPHDIEEVEPLEGDLHTERREREMAQQLIEMLATSWEPERYHDTHRERVLELIEAKDRGEEVVVERPPEPAPVVDLMAALEESVRSGRRRDREGAGGRLADRSREELYEEAKRRDIPGRSRMSKRELIDALRAAS